MSRVAICSRCGQVPEESDLLLNWHLVKEHLPSGGFVFCGGKISSYKIIRSYYKIEFWLWLHMNKLRFKFRKPIRVKTYKEEL